ncbi:MAG: hypothetical protein ACI8PG_002851 [Planctomycetota bacterium]|jgi:hypothetical protein
MTTTANAPEALWAGVAKVDITRTAAGELSDPLYANIDAETINDRLYAKALVLKQSKTIAVIIAVDAVAIAEIGSIRDEYLASVRAQLHEEFQIEAAHVMINASHCHGVVCEDIAERPLEAVRSAWQRMEPVEVGVGSGYEDRIMENRRLRLQNGREADVRHAYSLVADSEVAGVGPVDPEIGILRLDRSDGRTLAVVYNFACHPIQGVPSGGNTADLSGFASKAIEECLGDDAIALFIQGCAGDINPVFYKAVDFPRDAETLGNLLGLSTVRALHSIETSTGGALKVINETLALPRADLAPPIAELKEQQQRLLAALRGTTLNLKTFIPLLIKYQLSPDYPSYYAHRYQHEEQMGREHLAKLDDENRKNLALYIDNIHTMEELTRLQANLGLLEMHQQQNVAAATDAIETEVMGLRIGDFVLVTFPGELSVQTGLNLKKASPHERTFVAGVTNGYIYYTPTAKQLENRGGAQEDSDCLVASAWQGLFEDKAIDILNRL